MTKKDRRPLPASTPVVYCCRPSSDFNAVNQGLDVEDGQRNTGKSFDFKRKDFP